MNASTIADGISKTIFLIGIIAAVLIIGAALLIARGKRK